MDQKNEMIIELKHMRIIVLQKVYIIIFLDLMVDVQLLIFIESDFEDDDYLGIDNEAFNHSSIMSWTARAGSYVAEKMAFFEKLGEDYRSGGGFFER